MRALISMSSPSSQCAPAGVRATPSGQSSRPRRVIAPVKEPVPPVQVVALFRPELIFEVEVYAVVAG